MKRRLGLVFLLTSLILLGGRETANVAQLPIPERPVILDELIPPLEGIPVTVDEVSRLALLGNLDIRMARLDLAVKQTEVMGAVSRFDTHVDINLLYQWVNQEQPTVVLGNKTITTNTDLSIAGKSRIGLETELFYDNQRNSTNSTFASLNPNYESHAGVRLRQPLLRNAFGFIDRSEVKLVKLELSRFREEVLDRIEKDIFDAREAYWHYVRDAGLIRPAEESYQTAKRLFEITRDQLETGLKEETDFYAAEANLRKWTQELLMAHLNVRQSMNQLKLALHQTKELLPSAFPEPQPVEISYENVFDQALASRRDYRRKKKEIEAKGLQVKVSRMKRWPKADFVGTVGTNALDPNSRNVHGKLLSFNRPTYEIGLEVTLPVQNRAARAEARRSEYEKERAKLELQRLVQQIQVETDNAYRELLGTGEIAKQSRLIRTLDRRKLKTAESQFRIGRLSSTTVIDFQEDLAASEKSRIESIVSYEIAKDKLALVQNKLLSSIIPHVRPDSDNEKAD